MFKAAQVIKVEVVSFKFPLGNLHIPNAFLNLLIWAKIIKSIRPGLK